MRSAVLLTDLDNTWFNWVDFFGRSLRAMVHAVAIALRASEDDVYDQLRALYQEHGTLEFRYAIQHLPIYQSASDQSKAKALRAGRVAFGRSRSKRLAMYDGAKETLDWLVDQEVSIIAVTNSPVIETLGRLRSLGISRHFSGLVGWRGASGLEALLSQRIASTRIEYVVPLSEHALKPNPEAYTQAIAAFGRDLDKRSLWVLGDSLTKDLQPAASLGATTIWARYGRAFDQKNFDTLLRVTHWSDERIQSTYVSESYESDYVIDSIQELRDIIPPIQATLF